MDGITGGIKSVIQAKLALLIFRRSRLPFADSPPLREREAPFALESAVVTPPKVSLSSNQIVAPIRCEGYERACCSLFK